MWEKEVSKYVGISSQLFPFLCEETVPSLLSSSWESNGVADSWPRIFLICRSRLDFLIRVPTRFWECRGQKGFLGEWCKSKFPEEHFCQSKISEKVGGPWLPWPPLSGGLLTNLVSFLLFFNMTDHVILFHCACIAIFWWTLA